jgi:protoporphyrinogen oxidase
VKQKEVGSRPFLVIGAGPAGLTAAYALAKAGVAPFVCERLPIEGGLARTEVFDGYRFDMGGHRFFTKSAEINALWHEILGDEFLKRPRLSRIYYRKRFFDYPLRPYNAMRNLGIIETVRVLASFARWKLFPHKTENTFAQWVTNRFGKRLFEIFFKSYTEKVWGISTDELSSDWAVQRIKNLSLGLAILNAFSRSRATATSLIEEFHYPRLGPGMMWATVADRIRDLGGTVQTKATVKEIYHDGSVIQAVRLDSNARENVIEVEQLISSIPITTLVQSLRPAPPTEILNAAASLRHRDFLTVGLVLKRENVFPDNWIYIHDPDVRVGRIQNYKNWSPSMVPDQMTTSLGLEYFCNEAEPLWLMSDVDLIELGSVELEKLGISQKEDVLAGCVFRVPKAYPIYDASYQDRIATLRSYVLRFLNLHTVGRNGLHRYDNQDHAMLTGLYVARNLLEGTSFNVWDVNTEAAYLEDRAEAKAGRTSPESPAKDSRAKA